MKNDYPLDPDIREALKLALRETDPSAAIIDEMPLLRGRGRADLAFVNGKLCGYEIKSDGDSLIRLGTQADQYQSVFEMVTLVAAKKHIKHARNRVPRSWGIIEVERRNGKITLRHRRKPRLNRSLNRAALARLLWKNECIRILRKAGLLAKPQTPVRQLWQLVEAMPSDALCREVRGALKRRHQIIHSPQILCDGSSTTEATA